MKNFKFFLPLAALGILASCSNDNLGDPVDGSQLPAEELGPGTYLNIALSIPSNGGRAEYSDGEANEYAVKDATLYIFDNDDTDDTPGKCIDVITLDSYFENPTNNHDQANGITQTKELHAIQVDETIMQDASDKVYWALVILNGGGLYSKPSKESATVFKDWIKTSQTCEMIDGTFFTMTNALGWDGGPTASNPTHLAQITEDNLYHESQDQGETVHIFVQRGVAKVTLSGDAVTNGMSPDGTAKKYLEKVVSTTEDEGEANISNFISIDAWYLDITNQSTYPVLYLGADDSNNWWSNSTVGMNIAGTSSWNNLSNPLDRFIGQTTKYTRMFWGVDPNYSTSYELKSNGSLPDVYPFNYNSNYTSTPDYAVKKQNEPAYCLENTFAVPQMHQIQSTRIIIEGTYWVDVNKDETEQYNDNKPVGTPKTFVSTMSGSHYATIPVSLTTKLGNKASGTYKVNTLFGAVADLTVDEKTAYDNFLKELDMNPGSTSDVNLYVNGKVYYKVIIRHFNDTELALGNNGYTLIGDDYYEDGKNDVNLLGRYGMVRNNWYEVSISDILGPGLPVVPPPTDIPDDEPAKLMLDCEIHILDWAKRSQDVDLK